MRDFINEAGFADWIGTAAGSAPAAPSSLTATAVSSSQIDLAWTDNSADETGFEVYRSTDDITYTLINTTAAGATSYSATGLSGLTTYYFKVRAVNAFGASADAGPASAKTQAALLMLDLGNGAAGTLTGKSPDVSTIGATWQGATSVQNNPVAYSGTIANTLTAQRWNFINIGQRSYAVWIKGMTMDGGGGLNRWYFGRSDNVDTSGGTSSLLFLTFYSSSEMRIYEDNVQKASGAWSYSLGTTVDLFCVYSADGKTLTVYDGSRSPLVTYTCSAADADTYFRINSRYRYDRFDGIAIFDATDIADVPSEFPTV